MKTLHFFALSFSIIFVVVTYIILYRETLRHRKRIRRLNRVYARRPCWRSKTIKLFSFGKKFNSHAKIFLLFSPPTWPSRTYSIASTNWNWKIRKRKQSAEDNYTFVWCHHVMVSAQDCLSVLNNSIIQQNQVLSFASGEMKEILSIVIRTPGMLNSLVNPLIYCMHQKEMRKFVFSLRFSRAIKIVCLCVNWCRCGLWKINIKVCIVCEQRFWHIKPLRRSEIILNHSGYRHNENHLSEKFVNDIFHFP